MRHATIFHKTLLGYLSVALFTLLLTGVLSFWLIQRVIISQNTQDLTDKAKAVSMMVSLDAGDMHIPGRRVREIETLCNAQLVFVDDEMTVRRLQPRKKPNATTKSDASSTAAEEPWNDAPPPVAPDTSVLTRINIADTVDSEMIRAILSGETVTDVRKLAFLDTPVLFVGTKVTDGATGDIAGGIILCRPITSVNENSRNMFLHFAMAGGLAMLAAVGMAFVASRRQTRPIHQLTRMASHIAEGHFDERIALETGDEVGVLADNVNLLAARVGDLVEKLSNEKSRLEQILSSIGEGIVAVDADGRVILHNGAALPLLNLSEWAADSPQQSQLFALMNRAVTLEARQEDVWTIENTRTIQAVATPVLGADGAQIGAVCLIRDVSEAQRMEQLQRDYVANVSHELRTPLTGIRAMVEPLLDGILETQAEKDDCYRVIYQETIRLQKLIGDMLDLSRLQDGRVEIEVEPMNPTVLLDVVQRRFRERAQTGGIELCADVPEPDLFVLGNEDRILQVLTILTDNALSFTKPGGRVTLFFRRGKPGFLALGVSDTGAGIDPADQPYIWQRFYKADKSRMRTAGTGLGLPIAWRVVTLMGGEIDVQTAVGHGSTFTFTLPEARRDSC